jgi:hypothetical protein
LPAGQLVPSTPTILDSDLTQRQLCQQIHPRRILCLRSRNEFARIHHISGYESQPSTLGICQKCLLFVIGVLNRAFGQFGREGYLAPLNGDSGNGECCSSRFGVKLECSLNSMYAFSFEA